MGRAIEITPAFCLALARAVCARIFDNGGYMKLETSFELELLARALWLLLVNNEELDPEDRELAPDKVAQGLQLLGKLEEEAKCLKSFAI
jgi:hypothetical protein